MDHCPEGNWNETSRGTQQTRFLISEVNLALILESLTFDSNPHCHRSTMNSNPKRSLLHAILIKLNFVFLNKPLEIIPRLITLEEASKFVIYATSGRLRMIS